MKKTTLPKEVSIGQLREDLKYRSREAMNSNWSFVFGGEVLPDDHLFVPIEQALEFVAAIAIPQRGRPGTITGAAQQLLKTWRNPPQEEQVNPVAANFKEVESEVSEKSGLNGTAQVPEMNPSVLIEKIRKEEESTLPGSTLSFRAELKKVEKELRELSDDQRKEKKGIELLKKAKFLEMKIGEIERSTKTFGRFDFIFRLTGLDWAYLVTVGIADYGLVYLLKEMGLAAAIVYTLISFHALAMAKNRKSQRTAQNGIVAVWLLEALAFFVHLTLFNKRLWGSIEDLPFQVAENLTDESRPFLIAVIMATLFSAAGIYAVSTTLALLKEKIEAEEYERQYGIEY